MSIYVPSGQTLPLWLRIDQPDEEATYTVTARVTRRYPYQLLHDALVLTAIVGALGEFENTSVTMGDELILDVIYTVFNGETFVGSAQEVFTSKGASGEGGGAPVGELVGLIQSTNDIVGIVHACQ